MLGLDGGRGHGGRPDGSNEQTESGDSKHVNTSPALRPGGRPITIFANNRRRATHPKQRA
jgi:hypothetical protein